MKTQPPKKIHKFSVLKITEKMSDQLGSGKIRPWGTVLWKFQGALAVLLVGFRPLSFSAGPLLPFFPRKTLQGKLRCSGWRWPKYKVVKVARWSDAGCHRRSPTRGQRKVTYFAYSLQGSTQSPLEDVLCGGLFNARGFFRWEGIFEEFRRVFLGMWNAFDAALFRAESMEYKKWRSFSVFKLE